MAADPMVDLPRRFPFTVAEYEFMGEAGIFDPASMSPIGSRHACVVNRLNEPVGDSYHGMRTVRRGGTITPTAIGDPRISTSDILGE